MISLNRLLWDDAQHVTSASREQNRLGRAGRIRLENHRAQVRLVSDLQA
jgi:hypothetical protein